MFSATAKLLSIDSFEIYVFGFQILSLGGAFLAARLVICLEYALGLLLIANLDRRFTYWATFATLAAFSLFLFGLILSGNRENCHCFGEFVNLNPWQSLLKNLALILILCLSADLEPFPRRRRWIWYAAVAALSLAAVFIVSPPDNWRYDSYSLSTTVNEEALGEALADGTLPSDIMEGDKVVCFYSLKCEFCRMSAQKIGTMRRMGTFSAAPLVAVIGRGEDLVDPKPFFEQARLDCSEWHFIEPARFLRITNGEMPLILVLHEGRIVEKYSYRDIRQGAAQTE